MAPEWTAQRSRQHVRIRSGCAQRGSCAGEPAARRPVPRGGHPGSDDGGRGAAHRCRLGSLRRRSPRPHDVPLRPGTGLATEAADACLQALVLSYAVLARLRASRVPGGRGHQDGEGPGTVGAYARRPLRRSGPSRRIGCPASGARSPREPRPTPSLPRLSASAAGSWRARTPRRRCGDR